MDINLLLTKLAKYHLPTDQYAIVGSGAMAIRGIREANDLDIVVTKKLWDELSTKYPERVNKEKGFTVLELEEEIEILWEGSFFVNSPIASVEEQISTADTLQGCKFVRLDLTKKFKKARGMEKDLRDLELIEKYEKS